MGRVRPETGASPASVPRADKDQQLPAGVRGVRPCPALAGAQPCARACVSPRRPLPRALRLRLLRRTRAASLRAARGGGHGRRAPNLSDPRSRPGAAGAAGERSAPLSRGSGPSCASRPYQAGRGRGDERRPRGSAPGRRAAPSRSPGALEPALCPLPPWASELVSSDGAPLIYNVFRFPQDGEERAAVPSRTGAPVK